jgi:hypothetical protein
MEVIQESYAIVGMHGGLQLATIGQKIMMHLTLTVPHGVDLRPVSGYKRILTHLSELQGKYCTHMLITI